MRLILFTVMFILFNTYSIYGVSDYKGKPLREFFRYYQDFTSDDAPAIGDRVRYPFHFNDIDENNRLSSWWPYSSWEVVQNGVRVVNSRVQQVHSREQSIYEDHYGGYPFVTIRRWRTPWFTLYMRDEDWTDYTVETTITPDFIEHYGEHTTAGIAFRYKNARQYYAFFLTKRGTGKLVRFQFND